MAGEILECIYRDGMAYVSFTEYQRVVEKNLADLKYAKDWKELCNKTKDELESLKIGLEQARGDRNRVFEEKMQLKDQLERLKTENQRMKDAAIRDYTLDFEIRQERDWLKKELACRKLEPVVDPKDVQSKYLAALRALAEFHNSLPYNLKGADQ